MEDASAREKNESLKRNNNVTRDFQVTLYLPVILPKLDKIKTTKNDIEHWIPTYFAIRINSSNLDSLFNGHRRHILPSRCDDELLYPPRDEVEAVGVRAAEIPGVEPAVGVDRLGGLARVVWEQFLLDRIKLFYFALQ